MPDWSTDMELKSISKSYGDRVVLNDFSLSVNKGETLLISGASGRGKTTLLRLMMGIEKPDSGEMTGLPERASAVFQEDRLPPEFSAYKCLRYALPSSVSKEAILQSLSDLGLEGEEQKAAKELSGGMRRRVSIIRAMLHPSDAVFLDEPFTGLDPETKLSAIKYILDKANGRTIIAVSHAKEDAALLNAREIEI